MKFEIDNRTLKERLVDKLLLLYLIDKFRFDGKTKIHKAVFTAEKHSNDRGLKIFNLNFIRYNFGQFSPQMWQDFIELSDKGLIIDVFPIELTEDGKDLLKRCESIFSWNRKILHTVEPIIEHIADLPLDKVKEIMYTKVIIKGKKIADIEKGTPILNKLNKMEIQNSFDIPNKWIDKLEFMLNTGIVKIDDDTKNEIMEIHRTMKSKRVGLLRKLDKYEEEVC